MSNKTDAIATPINHESICVDVILVNKMDLLPYSNFDMDAYIKAVRGLNPKVDVIEVSCTTGAGIKKWLSWLKGQLGKSPKKQK